MQRCLSTPENNDSASSESPAHNSVFLSYFIIFSLLFIVQRDVRPLLNIYMTVECSICLIYVVFGLYLDVCGASGHDNVSHPSTQLFREWVKLKRPTGTWNTALTATDGVCILLPGTPVYLMFVSPVVYSCKIHNLSSHL